MVETKSNVAPAAKVEEGKQITYHDAIAKIATKLNYTQTAVRAVLSELQGVMIESLETDGNFFLSGVGNFRKVIRQPKEAINMQTKARVVIPARPAVSFRVSKNVKSALKVK